MRLLSNPSSLWAQVVKQAPVFLNLRLHPCFIHTWTAKRRGLEGEGGIRCFIACSSWIHRDDWLHFNNAKHSAPVIASNRTPPVTPCCLARSSLLHRLQYLHRTGSNTWTLQIIRDPWAWLHMSKILKLQNFHVGYRKTTQGSDPRLISCHVFPVPVWTFILNKLKSRIMSSLCTNRLL